MADTSRPLRENDPVTINPASDHPWGGLDATAVRHERYGPSGVHSGWLVRLADGQESHATPVQLLVAP